MVHKTKRQRQAEQTRQKLYDEAVTAFADRGYRNVSVEEICRRCGVSKGTFYVHFKSKEEIVAISIAQKITTIGQKITAYSSAGFATPQRLNHYLLSLCELIADLGKESVQGVFMVGASNESSLMETFYKDALFLVELKPLISEGRSVGEFTDKLSEDFMLRYIVSFIVGLLFMWCKSEAADLEEMAAALVPCFVKGISGEGR